MSMEPIPILGHTSGGAEDYILPVEYKWISGTEKMLVKYWMWVEASSGSDRSKWVIVEVIGV